MNEVPKNYLGALGGDSYTFIKERLGQKEHINVKQEHNDALLLENLSIPPKNKSKKKYSIITQEIREKFINKVLSNETTIKEAAKEFGLKFSTSKAILQIYKKEGRIGKKKYREKKTNVVNTVIATAIDPYSQGNTPLAKMDNIKEGSSISPIQGLRKIEEPKAQNLSQSILQSTLQKAHIGNSLEYLQRNLLGLSFQPQKQLLGKLQPTIDPKKYFAYSQVQNQFLTNPIINRLPLDNLLQEKFYQQQLLLLQNKQQQQLYNNILLQSLNLHNQACSGLGIISRAQFSNTSIPGNSLPTKLINIPDVFNPSTGCENSRSSNLLEGCGINGSSPTKKVFTQFLKLQ